MQTHCSDDIPVKPTKFIEWLGFIPADWNVLPLKYAAREVTVKLDIKPQDSIYIGLEHIESGTGRLNLSNVVEEVASSVVTFQRGDVVFGKLRPYLAKAFLAEFDGVATSEVIVYRPTPNVLGRYLLYLMLSERFINTVDAMTYGSKMPRANSEQIGAMPVPVPPLDQQRRVAAYLDRETARIDALIAAKQELLQTLAEKRQALITHAVTRGLDASVPRKDSGLPWLGEMPAHWNVVRLKHLALRVGSGKTPLGGAEVYVTEGVTFLRSQNVYDDGLRLDDVAYITEEVDAAMASTRVKANDILLNITGASLGRTCLVPDGLGPANVNQHVCIIRLKDEASTPLVALAMKAQPTKHQISALENGTSREGLNFEQIGNITLAYPPSAEERTRIVEELSVYMTRIEVMHSTTVETIEMLKKRRAALIAAAVTGQIGVEEI